MRNDRVGVVTGAASCADIVVYTTGLGVASLENHD